MLVKIENIYNQQNKYQTKEGEILWIERDDNFSRTKYGMIVSSKDKDIVKDIEVYRPIGWDMKIHGDVDNYKLYIDDYSKIYFGSGFELVKNIPENYNTIDPIIKIDIIDNGTKETIIEIGDNIETKELFCDDDDDKYRFIIDLYVVDVLWIKNHNKYFEIHTELPIQRIGDRRYKIGDIK